MNAQELREKFLQFFQERGHTLVPSSSLIPTDPSVLFTTAGMQQFKPYYLEEKSPFGNNVTSCQKCFRTSDIEEVGDERHLTFLEMLGNFSFGGYFKKEAIKMAFQFLFGELKFSRNDVFVTVFQGDKDVPFDKESFRIWRSLGLGENQIKKFPREDNFWGPTGLEGPCGPTTEIYVRGLEIWNLVFNEYFQDKRGKLSLLKMKGVDTGMGLERLTMVVEGKNSVFETELFSPLIESIPGDDEKAKRIIADHIKSTSFLITEGIFPSNLGRGYVLRRLIRRAVRYSKMLGLGNDFLINLIPKVGEIYKGVYPELLEKTEEISNVVFREGERFEKTLENGLKEFNNLLEKYKERRTRVISGKDAFNLYQSYGFPLELTEELAQEKGLQVEKEGFWQQFRRHQEISRIGAEKKFGGIGKKPSQEAVKLHTATHLLHAALRKVLGESVRQMGSDITPQRLRFDFSWPRKLTKEEIKKVEELVNEKIGENLEVKREEMNLKEAINSGALAFFKEKYPERVSVYSIGNFSKEVCAGPHVNRTGELGVFRIIKEESLGSGVRRIKAILE